MRKHRFYLLDNIKINDIIDLEANTTHQIINVLRLKVGDIIYIFNNSNQEFAAEIIKITRKQVVVKINNVFFINKESNLKIHLAQAISKSQKMDLTIQKAIELGVHTITPVITKYSIVQVTSSKLKNKMEHWQKIITAACGQSGRNLVPCINPPILYEAWIEQQQLLSMQSIRLLLNPLANNKIKDLNIKNNENIILLIGPEGGFCQEEIKLAKNNNFVNISLGPRILRTETAAIAAIAGLQILFGDC